MKKDRERERETNRQTDRHRDRDTESKNICSSSPGRPVLPEKLASTPHHADFFLHQCKTLSDKFVVFVTISDRGPFCLVCYSTANIAVVIKRKCSAIAHLVIEIHLFHKFP